jgi:alpha-ribazole phosphatase
VRLVVVRHGETASNAERRFTGQMDVPLNALGERQARAVAQALAQERFDRIVASDLLRARQTAQAIASVRLAPVELDPDVREIALGAWEGLTRGEVRERYPADLARWDANDQEHAPPGGETVAQLAARVERAMERACRAQAAGRVLWVTHGGVIGVLICLTLGLDYSHRGQFRRNNAAITELALGEHGGTLLRLNDTHHLEELGSGERNQVL